MKSKYILKSHNKTMLLYHIVVPIKYRKKVITEDVEKTIVATCKTITERYGFIYHEIGCDLDHIHFLIQSPPKYSVSVIVQRTKSLIAKEVFRLNPEVKAFLWGGEFFTDGFYADSVGRHASEQVIRKYVRQQGNIKDYKQMQNK